MAIGLLGGYGLLPTEPQITGLVEASALSSVWSELASAEFRSTDPSFGAEGSGGRVQKSTMSGAAGVLCIERRRLAWLAGVQRSYSETTIEAVIGLIAKGDADALGELDEPFCRLAHGLAFCVARDPALAEDAIEAFLSVYRSAAGFNVNPPAPRRWLSGIVDRQTADLADRSVRRGEKSITLLAQGTAGHAERCVDQAAVSKPGYGRMSRPTDCRSGLNVGGDGWLLKAQI